MTDVVTVGLDRYAGEPDIDPEKVQRYIVLRQFVSHEGTHYLGDKLPKKVATDPTWNQSGLLSLVGGGFIYPVAENDTYDRLPAHVYNAIKSQQELDGIIAVGESPVTFNEWVEATEVSRVRDQIDEQHESEERNAALQRERAEKLQQTAISSQVEPRPVVVPHKIPAVDAMKAEAERAAQREHNTAKSDEYDETEKHSSDSNLGESPKKQSTPSSERDGADVQEPVHTEPTTKPDTEGPDESETTTVVPSSEGSTQAHGPVRSYEDMTKPELQAELKEQGKPTSGNKDELIARLQDTTE